MWMPKYSEAFLRCLYTCSPDYILEYLKVQFSADEHFVEVLLGLSFSCAGTWVWVKKRKIGFPEVQLVQVILALKHMLPLFCKYLTFILLGFVLFYMNESSKEETNFLRTFFQPSPRAWKGLYPTVLSHISHLTEGVHNIMHILVQNILCSCPHS